MTVHDRIAAFTKLGGFISRHLGGIHEKGEETLHEALDQVIAAAHLHNNWFIPKFTHAALSSLASYLTGHSLQQFTAGLRPVQPKTVALICAGNVPMVGFHDIMCTLLGGHRALIKLSSDDNVLLPFFLKLLTHYEKRLEDQISFASGRLSAFDAVIATGSNNTAKHFEYYFGKYPRIIRKNRSSVALIDGQETNDEFLLLGDDIFLYFGLGCRNVSKLLVPESYDFGKFFEAIHPFGFVVDNNKYGNNYDYNRALYLLGQQPFLDNNFLILKEDKGLHAPVAVLYYERFADHKAMQQYVDVHREELQCVVGRSHIPFGYSQRPVITDFADNIDTLSFLVNL
jgi:hypothetical protein